MLPESKFPVTGGIMQSEEIVARSHPLLLDASGASSECRIAAIDRPIQLTSPQQQQQLHQQPAPAHLYPLQLLSMAVKQEPAEEEERARQPNALSPQMEIEDGQSLADAGSLAECAGRRQSDAQQLKSKFEMGRAAQASGNATCKKQPSRGRRKSRWKLKFHHQALPPEYLDHYEAALAQEAAAAGLSPPGAAQHASPGAEAQQQQQQQQQQQPGCVGPTDVQSWLQRFALLSPGEACPPGPGPRRSVITSTSALPSCPPAAERPAQPEQPAGRPPMQYSDLPYMGEITLDNSKPRRGRKPKKADICHLIYKNYGTILPGTPGLQEERPAAQEGQAQPAAGFQRSDVQNRISSLLERRLTQERRALDEAARGEQDGPLNLCVRDSRPARSGSPSSEPEDLEAPADCQPGPPLRCWPAGALLHPASLQFLYYQKLAQERVPEQQQQRALAPVYPGLLEAGRPPAGSPGPAGPEEQPPASPRPRRSPGQPSSAPGPPAAKRKRSAIFIPPVPTDSSGASPATEVSICKFKFTGGARPSLQEKKSLSVDSGGNFRYYSGTGDKSLRGYEFFPREALQQQQQQPAQPTQPAPARPALSPQRQAEDARQARKRKTRKSIQREKLEQTFKEKGFLIQTQQLESAEGATYCKFRQLRKFTRYLFRSWKDYLPGSVRELNGPGAQGPAGEPKELLAVEPAPALPADQEPEPQLLAS